MNLGDLLDKADEALRAAAAGMEDGPGPADTVDVLTAITARSNVYIGLARCVEALSGGTLTINRQVPDFGTARAVAVNLLGVRGQQTNKLYAGLRAAGASGGYPPGTSANTPASRNLLRAADLVGAAADLLAGHVPPDQPPRTREGAAIRAGGAIREGLAAIARLTHQTIQVDAQLGGWFGRGHAADRTFADQYGPALQPARWTVASGLDELAGQMMANATGKPNLRLLAPASPTVIDTPTTPTDPAARFRAVRDWLRLNPTNIDARHLRAGTQLGLAIALFANEPPRGPWRAASVAAVQLSSAPSDGPASYVASELADLTATVRNRLHATPDPTKVEDLANFGPALPELADALRAGLSNAVARRGIFVAEAGLSPQPIRLIYRYQTTVRVATDHDHAITELDRGLVDCVKLAAGPFDRLPAQRFSSRTAALAFPSPPRPTATAHAAASQGPDRSIPERHRHR